MLEVSDKYGAVIINFGILDYEVESPWPGAPGCPAQPHQSPAAVSGFKDSLGGKDDDMSDSQTLEPYSILEHATRS